MVKGSSIARLKKRAQQALKKDAKDRTYKEVKDISSWRAVTERWEAMKGNDYVKGRSQIQNVKAVIKDVLGHGNEKCLLPGQPEARWGALSKQHGGLLFTKAEIGELNHLAHEVGDAAWNLGEFKSVQV